MTAAVYLLGRGMSHVTRPRKLIYLASTLYPLRASYAQVHTRMHNLLVTRIFCVIRSENHMQYVMIGL